MNSDIKWINTLVSSTLCSSLFSFRLPKSNRTRGVVTLTPAGFRWLLADVSHFSERFWRWKLAHCLARYLYYLQGKSIAAASAASNVISVFLTCSSEQLIYYGQSGPWRDRRWMAAALLLLFNERISLQHRRLVGLKLNDVEKAFHFLWSFLRWWLSSH